MAEEMTPKSDFVREKIKDKPKSKKKLLLHLLYMALCGLVFGLMVTLVLVICVPRIVKKAGVNGTAATDPELTEVYPTAGTEVVTPVEHTIIEFEQLSIDDYQVLQNQIYAIGQECNKSIVSILGVSSETDLFNKPYETSGVGSGVIIQDAGSQILILTESRIVAEKQDFYVTFVNGESCPASIIGRDVNTGLAVLAVEKKDIDQDTIGRIGIAVISDFSNMHVGSMVIAIGSPLGAPYSVLTGNVTSVTNEVSGVDHNYEVLTTDIIGTKDGSGVLINTKGEIVGFVMQSLASTESAGTITAVKISEIKTIISKLSEGKSVPYLGMKVATVTARMEDSQGIPRGAYVRSVAMDSPAMNYGLQNGDVIVKMNGEMVGSAAVYSTRLMALEPNQTISIVVMRKGANGYSEISYKITVGVLQ